MGTYIKDRKDSEVKEKISIVITEYYRLDSIQQCNEMATLFTPIVEDYFNQSNITKEEMVQKCVQYRNKWPFYKNDVDIATLVIRKGAHDNYIASFRLLYKIKQRANDNWKKYPLKIRMEFNKDFKITTINEDKIN